MTGTAPEPQPPPVVVVTADPVVRKRAEAAARDMGAILLGFRSTQESDLPAPPRVFVVDLGVAGAEDAIGGWKQRFPRAPVVGVLAVPDAAAWERAERAGADLVCTPGVLRRRLPDFLDEYARRGGARRVRVASLRDFEGRLGYVGRIDDGVPEEIALYHVGYEIHAIGNVCPHAGARLSEGELDGTTLTCPLHGSQFDVRTGERVRGPSDDAVRSYRVVVEDGSVLVEIEDDG